MVHPEGGGGSREEAGGRSGVWGRRREGLCLEAFVSVPVDEQAADRLKEQVGCQVGKCHCRGGLAKAFLGLWFLLSEAILKTRISLKVHEGDMMF